MGTKKVMKLIDPNGGLMECKVCGAQHRSDIRNGRYRRGSWQCPHGCKLDDPKSKKTD